MFHNLSDFYASNHLDWPDHQNQYYQIKIERN